MTDPLKSFPKGEVVLVSDPLPHQREDVFHAITAGLLQAHGKMGKVISHCANQIDSKVATDQQICLPFTSEPVFLQRMTEATVADKLGTHVDDVDDEGGQHHPRVQRIDAVEYLQKRVDDFKVQSRSKNIFLDVSPVWERDSFLQPI